MAEDKRVRYTKMFLKESLIKLLQNKPISRITIKELCENAEINRTTYYSHYSDQFDQLKQIEEDLIRQIVTRLNSLSVENHEKDMLRTVQNIMLYISENRELCKVLLGRNGDIDFQDNIIEIIRTQIPLFQNGRFVPAEIADDLFLYMATGCIGVIRKWLFSENDNRTPEEMALFIINLTTHGLSVFQK